MTDFIVILTAHIDERVRPEGFPKIIKDSTLVSFDNIEGLLKFVNNRVLFYAQTNGFTGVLDSSKMEDLRVVDTNRVFVPMRMITHITPFYKQVSGEVPFVTAEGGTELPSGKDVVKH